MFEGDLNKYLESGFVASKDTKENVSLADFLGNQNPRISNTEENDNLQRIIDENDISENYTNTQCTSNHVQSQFVSNINQKNFKVNDSADLQDLKYSEHSKRNDLSENRLDISQPNVINVKPGPTKKVETSSHFDRPPLKAISIDFDKELSLLKHPNETNKNKESIKDFDKELEDLKSPQIKESIKDFDKELEQLRSPEIKPKNMGYSLAYDFDAELKKYNSTQSEFKDFYKTKNNLHNVSKINPEDFENILKQKGLTVLQQDQLTLEKSNTDHGKKLSEDDLYKIRKLKEEIRMRNLYEKVKSNWSQKSGNVVEFLTNTINDSVEFNQTDNDDDQAQSQEMDDYKAYEQNQADLLEKIYQNSDNLKRKNTIQTSTLQRGTSEIIDEETYRRNKQKLQQDKDSIFYSNESLYKKEAPTIQTEEESLQEAMRLSELEYKDYNKKQFEELEYKDLGSRKVEEHKRPTQKDDLLKFYQSKIALSPNDFSFYNQKANLHLSVIFEKSASQETDIKSALKCYNDFQFLKPDSLEALKEKGKIYLYEMKDFEQAIEFFDKILDMCFNESQETVRAQNNKALALYYLERYQDSIKNLDLAIKVDPLFSRSYYIKSRNLKNIGKYKQCMKMLQTVCEYSENRKISDSYLANDEWIGNVFCECGKVHGLKGRTTKAMDYLDKSIDRYGHIEGLVEKGILYIEMARYELAIKSFDTFQNFLEADYFELGTSLDNQNSDSNHTILTIDQKQKKKKLLILENICKYYKAVGLKLLKKSKDAQDLFNGIIEKDPTNPLFVFMKAHIFFELGNTGGNEAQAKQLFEKSQQLLDDFFITDETYDYLEIIMDNAKLNILDCAIKLFFRKITDKILLDKKHLLQEKSIKLLTRMRIIGQKELNSFLSECQNFVDDFKSSEITSIENLIKEHSEIKDYMKGFISLSFSVLNSAKMIQEDKLDALNDPTNTYMLLGSNFIKQLPFLTEEVFSYSSKIQSSMLTEPINSRKIKERANALILWVDQQIDYNNSIKEIIYKSLLNSNKERLVLECGVKKTTGVQDWFDNYRKVIEEYCDNIFEEFENPYMLLYSNIFMLGLKDFQDILDNLIFDNIKNLKEMKITKNLIIHFSITNKVDKNHNNYNNLSNQQQNPHMQTTQADAEYKPISFSNRNDKDGIHSNIEMVKTGNIQIDDGKDVNNESQINQNKTAQSTKDNKEGIDCKQKEVDGSIVVVTKNGQVEVKNSKTRCCQIM